MTTFTLSITIPEDLLDTEQAVLVSSTLHALATDISRWRAVPPCRRLRDRAGKVVGWAGTEEEDGDD